MEIMSEDVGGEAEEQKDASAQEQTPLVYNGARYKSVETDKQLRQQVTMKRASLLLALAQFLVNEISVCVIFFSAYCYMGNNEKVGTVAGLTIVTGLNILGDVIWLFLVKSKTKKWGWVCFVSEEVLRAISVAAMWTFARSPLGGLTSSIGACGVILTVGELLICGKRSLFMMFYPQSYDNIRETSLGSGGGIYAAIVVTGFALAGIISYACAVTLH